MFSRVIKMEFQSTPPARGATARITTPITKIAFQSTPPARGATKNRRKITDRIGISIHAPREGGDTINHHIIINTC